MIAVFADIHSNFEALEAVVADMNGAGIEERFCLGDIVGYAANPGKCLALVRRMGCRTVLGNHDEAAAGETLPYEMRFEAQAGIEFARLKLTREQRVFLAELPRTLATAGCEFVHASLNVPGDWNYVMETWDARDHFKFQSAPVAFCGHSHVPGVWHLDDAGKMQAWRGKGRIVWPADGKTLINVGSVGQPRDLCPDPCYVICDPAARLVEFRRVPYDVAKTQRKIARAKLPRFTRERLALGR